MQAKGIAHLGLLCSLSLFTNLSHAVTVSDLLISEVMANPAALSDARGEWFELYKPTTEAINLVASTFGRQNFGEGDEVLISEMSIIRISFPGSCFAGRPARSSSWPRSTTAVRSSSRNSRSASPRAPGWCRSCTSRMRWGR